jgi:hypothetical protein
MAGLEHGADFDSERLTAVIALIDPYARALALHLAVAIYAAAVWAYRTSRPQAGLYKFVCGFFVVEVISGENGHV